MKRLIKTSSKRGTGSLGYVLKGQMYTHTINHGGNIAKKYKTGLSVTRRGK